MFKALLARTIYDGTAEETSTRYAVLTKEVSLPFPPTLDIGISLGSPGPTKLRRITWNHDAAHFLCDFEEEFDTGMVDVMPHMDFLLSLAARDGWTVVSIDPVS